MGRVIDPIYVAYCMCRDKLNAHPKGYEFTMEWGTMSEAKSRSLRIIMHDFVKLGYIERVSDSETSTTFRKL